jgi:hypothetical protein
MTIKQLWSIIRGRRTNFRFLNASWTYYPDGDPMGKLAGGPAVSNGTSWSEKAPLPVGIDDTPENRGRMQKALALSNGERDRG